MTSNVAAPPTAFSITGTRLYVPFVFLSTQDIVKLVEQLKSGFKEQLTKINIK